MQVLALRDITTFTALDAQHRKHALREPSCEVAHMVSTTYSNERFYSASTVTLYSTSYAQQHCASMAAVIEPFSAVTNDVLPVRICFLTTTVTLLLALTTASRLQKSCDTM